MKGMTGNLHPLLTKHLLTLESRMGFELTITSGSRDLEHNTDVGGVKNSEHTYDPAEGADVFCVRPTTRFKMLKALMEMKISRIGIGKDFLHVGIAKEKPQSVAWTYYETTKKGTS